MAENTIDIHNSVCDLMNIGQLNVENEGLVESKNLILIVDDQEFNLEAIEIILKYKLKLDIKTTCVRANSGQ